MNQTISARTDKPNRAERRTAAHAERRGQQQGIQPRFVSIKQACAYLGCSRSYFYENLVYRVEIVPLGKRRLVDFDSLEALGNELLAAGAAAHSAPLSAGLAAIRARRGRPRSRTTTEALA
jgi:hypothetical protein